MKNGKIKIAIVSTLNASDIHAWSGTIYNFSQALKACGAELYFIDNLAKKRRKLLRRFEKIYQRIISIFLKKRHFNGILPSTLKFYAREIEKKLVPDTDIILCMTSRGINYVKSNKPKMYYSDGVSAGLFDCTPSFSNLTKKSIANLNNLEQTALNNCDMVIFSSDWAKDCALKYYKCNSDKIKVVPFGANIECNRIKNDIEKIIQSKEKDICRLLFVGRGWEVKGVSIALETARALHEKGVKVHLDIVGIKDCPVELPGYVENHGFIPKSTEDGKRKIDSLYEKAHFFILPTRSESFGIVFCEAASFGLPSLATRIGGVPNAVLDNKSGKLFDFSDNGEKYAGYIQAMIADFENYKKLCFSSFEQYEASLNWTAASKTVLKHIKELLDKKV